MKHSEHSKRFHGHKVVLYLLSFWVFGAAAYGQAELEKQGAEGKSDINPSNLPYRVTGADVPRYYLVRNFFGSAYSRYRVGGGLYEQFLADIGLELGTNAEVALVRAMERARELVYGSEGPIVERRENVPMETPKGRVYVTDVFEYGRGNQVPEPKEGGADEWRKRAEAYNNQLARDFADVYYDLLSELSERGISTAEIGDYIYNEIAPSASLASDRPLDKPSSVSQAFEDQLNLRRDQSQFIRK